MNINRIWQSLFLIIFIHCFTIAQNVEKELQRAVSEDKKGNYESAIKIYSKIIKERPDIIELFYLRGFTYMKNADYQNAIEDFTKCRDGNCQHKEFAYLNQAVCYKNLHQFTNALSNLTKVMEIYPSHTDAYVERGLLKIDYLKDPDGGCSDLTYALRLGDSTAGLMYIENCKQNVDSKYSTFPADFPMVNIETVNGNLVNIKDLHDPTQNLLIILWTYWGRPGYEILSDLSNVYDSLFQNTNSKIIVIYSTMENRYGKNYSKDKQKAISFYLEHKFPFESYFDPNGEFPKNICPIVYYINQNNQIVKKSISYAYESWVDIYNTCEKMSKNIPVE